MDNILPTLYKKYAEYDNYRSFPHYLDGLKIVEKRILYTAYLIARQKLTKSAKIVGNCMANLHPHGDNSIYTVLVGLVHQGFFIKQGNFGFLYGSEPTTPAAMRYTEVQLSKEIETVMFSYIKEVPYVMSEAEEEEEPKYIPTMFPICLLGFRYTVGIGTGYRVIYPCYSMPDLYKRLLWLIGEIKEEPIIKPISDCEILSTDDELKTLLTTGKARLKFRGIIEKLDTVCKVILKSWPYGKRFETIYSKFNNETSRGDIGFEDESNKYGTKIVFEVLKQRNRDKIYKDFVKKLENSITGFVSFEMIVINEHNKTQPISVDEMLLNTYNMYKQTAEISLNNQKVSINDKIAELSNLEKIKQPLIDVLNEKTITKDNYDEILKIVSDKSNISIEIIKELISKYNIKKLLVINTDIGDLIDQLKIVEDSVKNINEYVLNIYKIIGE